MKSVQVLPGFFLVSKAKIMGATVRFVTTGDDIHLTCNAELSPKPPLKVYWYRDDILIDSLLPRGGISVVTEKKRRISNLLISRVTQRDAGNYTCAPQNSQADSVMIHIIRGKF